VSGRRLVLALDSGTTSTRCLVFDAQGQMVSIAQREHHQHYPQPGWVEHDALEIWALAQKVVLQALADVGAGPAEVVGLGITNQRETTVVWDRTTGVPVHRAIVWQDTRTADLLTTFAAELGEAEIRARTGLPLATYFSAPKIRWLVEADPALQDGLATGRLLFGTIDTWLVWNMTGGVRGGQHLTDPTNASRTMLMDLDTVAWDPELLALARLPAAAVPEIRPSIGRWPVTVDPVPGIAISAVIGDQQASLFGQTAFDAGDAKCTLGTGSFLLLNTGTDLVRSSHGLITTVACTSQGEKPVYALEGAVATTGALVQWCRDSLGLIRTPAEIETLAAGVADNGGCYVVPAFSGLFAPFWDPHAQGIIVGLTSYVTKGHIARAVLDSTAWQARDLLEAMNAEAGVPARGLNVDGGMTSNNLLMQTMADVLDVPVVRPRMAETVALGAAFAAGLSVGLWPDQDVLRAKWQAAAVWRPTMDPRRRDAELARWRTAVRLSREWGRQSAPDAV
jgi:glycerol kinase